jgi:ABC-type phosphate transport system permease subunit
MLGALACGVLVLIAGMVVFVFAKAWPSFSHNGFEWFLPGGNVDEQLKNIFNSPANPHAYDYKINAWPLLYATALITVVSVLVGGAFAVLSAMFIVEFAPNALRRVLGPAVRLLAAVPSVIYGLIAVLVLVPFVNQDLISSGRKESVAYVVQLDGASILVAVIVLTVMITPIMVAIVADALRQVPRSGMEGAAALGVNRWRVLWTIGVRTARPAIVAAAVLATARALGEAIMLSMVSGSVGFAPNPLDGLTFFFEPARPLAATIVDNAEGLSVPPFAHTLYAFAAVLLVSTMILSLAGWAVKQPLRRYGMQA